MKKMLLIASLLTPGAASAADVDFAVENFQKTPTGAAEIVIRIDNRTNNQINLVAVSCGLLNDDLKAITMLDVMIENVPPNGHAYGNNFGPSDNRISKLDCRIRTVDFAS